MMDDQIGDVLFGRERKNGSRKVGLSDKVHGGRDTEEITTFGHTRGSKKPNRDTWTWSVRVSNRTECSKT